MSKKDTVAKAPKNETPKNAPVPATVEETPSPIKITGKTKFQKDSVEAEAVRDIKKREKKITTLGKSLVTLWIEQGKEILEFIAITEVSQRIASELLGVKRTSLNTYCTIASDPRMLNEDFQEALENFSQKDLIKLTKIDDEELFDQALEAGEIPKSEVIDVEVDEDGDATPVVDDSWKADLIRIIENADTFLDAKLALTDLFNDDEDEDESDDNGDGATPEAVEETEPEEVEVEPEGLALVNEAIELSGEDDLAEQALAIGIKKSVLKKALAGEAISKTTINKLTDYVNS